MSREIKFRAYDTERNMYVPQGEIIFKDYGETYFEVSPNCQEYIQDKCHNGEPQSNRFIIEQYTGLKDKNGTEVYENDIIELQNTEGNRLIKKVWFCENMCSLMIGNLRFSIITESGFFQPSQLIFEIIGNIHENPELLNQPTDYDY